MLRPHAACRKPTARRGREPDCASSAESYAAAAELCNLPGIGRAGAHSDSAPGSGQRHCENLMDLNRASFCDRANCLRPGSRPGRGSSAPAGRGQRTKLIARKGPYAWCEWRGSEQSTQFMCCTGLAKRTASPPMELVGPTCRSAWTRGSASLPQFRGSRRKDWLGRNLTAVRPHSPNPCFSFCE